MSDPDIRHLANEKLPTGSFPISKQSAYRVYFAPQTHAAILAHAGENTEFEICGVVVGTWEKDADGPFARITQYIRCDDAAKKFAEVTFTYESWAHINKEMDSKFTDLKIIGWYHSHPDFGIFLSDRDMFIQQNFFSGPGQIALVVDPVRHLEGIFEWHAGKTELMSHYWVGEQVVSSAAAKTPKTGSSPRSSASMEPSPSVINAPPARESMLMLVSTVLAWVCMFLMGYLVSGWWSTAERQLILEGTVAHFGAFKLMRIGWEEELQEVDFRLQAIAPEVKRLAEEHTKAAGDDGAKVSKQWHQIRVILSDSQVRVANARDRYGLSDAERAAMARLVTIKQAEVVGDRPLRSPPADVVLPDRTPTPSASAKEKSDVPVKQPAAKPVEPKPAESKSKPKPPEQGAPLPNGKLK